MKDNFEIIYQELYEKNNEILNNAKKEKNKKVLVTFTICVIFIILTFLITKENMALLMTISISVIIIMFVLIRENKKIRKIFKNNIIKELVKKYNPKLNFFAEGTINQQDYKDSKFDDSFDKFYSEDKIFGKIEDDINFEMAQIVTKKERKYKDAEGKTKTETIETFRGIYGIVKFEKKSNAYIYIAPNSITQKYNANRIEMDSYEFEQTYDCLTKDKLTAMKIFTADLLEKFVNLKKGKLNNFQLKIEDNYIYFRCGCGEVFEPPKIKAVLDKEVIKKYYDIIVIPTEIIEKIAENISRL